MTKTVLITGATGFLGSNLLHAFAHQENLIVIAACRDKKRLPEAFPGEVRVGDLRDPAYRQSVVLGVDIICHTGTWAAMWNHDQEEKRNFYTPTLDLIEKSIDAGVKRFLMTSTVAIARPNKAGSIIDDFSTPHYTGFWPHVDRLIDIDNYMKANAHRGMQMLTMRLGHFIGAGNTLGLVPALVPRLKTHLVPWIKGGVSRLPLVSDIDLANSFVAAAIADKLQDYESFNICGSSFPSTREVVNYIADRTGISTPLYSIPYPAAYAFAWLMEKLFPLLPGKGPFLTRSIVHLAEDWTCTTDYARNKLGYIPQKDWQSAMNEALDALRDQNYPWPYLTQKK